VLEYNGMEETMKGKQISRRDFLKGAAVGAVGIASAGLLGGCASDAASSSAGSNIKWDREVDVLVVGAGATGVSAAYEAAKAGAKTLILEKAGIAGGTTNYSGGVMQAAGTSVQKELTEFKDDTPEKHFQLWLKSGEGYVDEALVKDLAYGAPEHIEWLKSLGMKFVSVYGHCHVPYIDETLYADRIHVYEGGGAGGSGGILVNTILDAAKALGATIEYNTEVTKLITDASGRVIGASYTAGGSAFNIRTKKGVVLAASSIDWNEEMCRDLSPQQYWDITTQTCLCAKTNTGDGIRMGMELGAAIAGFGGTIDFCAKTGAATSNKVPLFPSFLVNKAGQRFVCEDATYAYHYRAIFQQEKQFDAPTYMIFGESSLIEGAPWNKESVAKDVADGVVITANTIEELANKIGVDADGLAATLADWNALAAKGKDVKFGRKTGLAPISGPFYAYRNVSCNLGALGGLKINTDTQVLKPNGEPIPGLYAGGLNAGGWIGPYYPGSGTALIGTVHWGRKAGANVAKL
jgi:urocanate reductase